MARPILGLLVISALGLVKSRQLCSTELGYEYFIQDIMENTPNNTVIGHVDIYGTDSEIFLQQLENAFFWLDPWTRNITLVALLDTDVGAPPIPTLSIICQQIADATSRPIEIVVSVLVEDWNDNPPLFNYDFHNTSIPEDAQIGTTVYTEAIATDKDKQYIGNSILSYRIVPGEEFSDYFRIDVSGKPVITLAMPLDYEQVTKMVIYIEATDSPSPKQGPQLTSTATLTVHVLDTDDLNPEFSALTYRGVISEDDLPDTIVDVTPRIVARDPDTMNVPVTYKLLDPYKLFSINATTAEVKLVTPIFPKIPTLTVVVLASQIDNDKREWFALLTISITEANINAPRFDKLVYEVVKTEFEPVNSTLVITTATDIDFNTVTGTIIKYSLIDAGPGFRIDSSGSVILEKPLDFEVEQKITLLVTASDGSHTATATVKIDVIDANDNSPVISGVGATTAIRMNREQGAVVIKLTATDKDVGNRLSFTLRNYEELFSISTDGELTITATPELLSRDSYPLLVSVLDDGVPPRETSTVVEVIFPSLGGTFPPTTETVGVAAASVSPADNTMLTIILGAVAGLLLVIIAMLIVYIVWRRKRTKEELDRAKAPKGGPAKGLTYIQAESPDDIPNIYGAETDDHDGYSEFDGSTSVQNNPLRASEVNDGYLQSSGSEIDRDLGEIEVETAVVPYDDDEDFNFPPTRPKYQNSHMRTFQGDDTTSSTSSDRQSDSTGGSRHALVKDREEPNGGSKLTSWDSDDKIHPQGAQKLIDQVSNPAPARLKKDRPEITVYF